MSTPTLYLDRATTQDKRIAPPRAYGRYAIAVRLRDVVVEMVQRAGGNEGKAKLIDFGCGDMPYRGLVLGGLAVYEGIDLPGNGLATYSLYEDGSTSAPAGCADVVLSTQVLEHVRDVRGYLQEVGRLLAEGGRLVLTTHGTWVYHGDPHDYWRWTGEGLKATLAEAGFEVVEFKGLLGLMPTGVQLFQDGLVRKLPKWMRSAVCFVLQQLMLIVDRFHTDGERAKDACVFAMIARKKVNL